MTTSALTIINSWHGTGSTNSWTDGSNLQCGTPNQGGNYRTKIAISTEGLVIGKSSKLVLAIKVNNESYPAHCNGILTELDIDDPGDVQNSNATGPSTELKNAAIATSIACYEDGTAYPAKWVDSGSTFYFVFDTDQLQAGKTYYIYAIRTATSDTWVKAAESSLAATLTYISYTACTAPTSFVVSPVVFDADVLLSWSGATDGANNSITGYEIEYATSLDGSAWSGWGVLKTVTGTSTEDVPGIDRGQYVKYRIRTQGSAGDLYFSDWKESNIATKDNEPYVYIHNDELNPVRHLAYIYDEQMDPAHPFGKYMPYVFDGTSWQRHS